ncbi:alpha/beta hydrolase [Candidatus Phycosocius spiralis]|uniref:Alpha/beta hydrolase n=2 Tax=Candidatus Phycosocius spiralis TaxID=2815099 RepID=A0ABQ4PUA3_9PROT|nr:alpha/beta hydrolase [Candidatus Phycosocius spiralis]
MLHGTGSSCHSWADLAPLLADRYCLIIPDLPGHGFSDTPKREGLSLPGMADMLQGLLAAFDYQPFGILGHSAGAAIGAHMALSDPIKPKILIAINGSFAPFEGLAGMVLPGAAQLLALNGIIVHAIASGAKDIGRVERLIRSTGSQIPPQALDRYRDLFAAPGHVAGVLRMMAAWDLRALNQQLVNLQVPLFLLTGSRDTAVPPLFAHRLARRVKQAHVVDLPGLGHLAHEENPIAVAEAIEQAFLTIKPLA